MQDFTKAKITRRRLLIVGGLSALGLLADACARAVGASLTPTPAPSGAGDTTNLPGVGTGKGAPPPAVSTPGQVPITSNADFYTVAIGADPDVPGDWKLQVGGNVDKPLTLTLDQIRQMPAVEEMRTLECISNPAGGPLISNAMWKGIKMRDLMQMAGVKSNTLEIKLEALDGYSTSIPLGLALNDHSLLAYEMNGAALPADHGRPLRCLWPGHYGMKQPKWLQKITATTDAYKGYWEQQGWSDQALIKPNSRIDAPADSGTVKPPTLTMSGVGFSGEAGIASIQVSWDNGKTWQAADLVRGPTPYVWTAWDWNGATPAPGQYTLLARVTDNSGKTQMPGSFSLLGDTFPDGTSAMQSVVITVEAAS